MTAEPDMYMVYMHSAVNLSYENSLHALSRQKSTHSFIEVAVVVASGVFDLWLNSTSIEPDTHDAVSEYKQCSIIIYIVNSRKTKYRQEMYISINFKYTYY